MNDNPNILKVSITLKGFQAEIINKAAALLTRGLYKGEGHDRARRFLIRQAICAVAKAIVANGGLLPLPLSVTLGKVSHLHGLENAPHGWEHQAPVKPESPAAPGEPWRLPASRAVNFPQPASPAPAAGTPTAAEAEQLAFAWDDLPNVPATVDDPVTRITTCIAEIARRMSVVDYVRN